MTRRALAAAGAATALALALTGCVAKSDLATAIPVTITDDGCKVATATAKAGTVTFELDNQGTDVNEFEVLTEDRQKIVAEKENVTPGQKIQYVAQLAPGDYVTACKFRKVGQLIGVAKFTVTGTESAAAASDALARDQAVSAYLGYIRQQTSDLQPLVKEFAAAYAAGDDAAAKAMFAKVREPYERIEPTAEAFGELDPKIDFREVDAVADGLDWTGFHRIEKDLWAPAPGALNSDGKDAHDGWTPSTPAQRAQLAAGLVADVAKLHELVTAEKFAISLADISNGAIGLLDEVAAKKITGEEDWWSGTDLADIAANVQGADQAFTTVRALAESKGSKGTALTAKIDAQVKALNAELAQYGSPEAGFADYKTLTIAQKKALSDQVNALSEPLSQLTHAVLGVQEQ